MSKNVLIIGAGHGLSASVARLFATQGMKIGLAARNTKKLDGLAAEIGAHTYKCDATDPVGVTDLFNAFDADFGSLDVLVYNPNVMLRGPISEVDPIGTKNAILVSAYGAFLAAQQAAIRMLKAGSGTMLFTGASAGIKGYPRSAPFAMGKFALRGLCQSLARELSPQNIHVAHFVIDGQVLDIERGAPWDDPTRTLDPDEIAKSYLHIANQHPSAWTWEIELRPSVEEF
ncbi:MAG: NAD(P)-dependent dehydrogenase (short-subunit alcohol dehydrogenase family) [Alphaproteobacteria bacterium]|jgi:NAD(P)-dependent dehydrogenase (short-subunit alcohol dehydrogenase family)